MHRGFSRQQKNYVQTSAEEEMFLSKSKSVRLSDCRTTLIRTIVEWPLLERL